MYIHSSMESTRVGGAGDRKKRAVGESVPRNYVQFHLSALQLFRLRIGEVEKSTSRGRESGRLVIGVRRYISVRHQENTYCHLSLLTFFSFGAVLMNFLF